MANRGSGEDMKISMLPVEEEKPLTKNKTGKLKIDRKTRKQMRRSELRRKESSNEIPEPEPEPVRYGGCLLSYDRDTAGRRGPGRSLNDKANLAIDFYNKNNQSADYRVVNVLRAYVSLSMIVTWDITFTAKLPHQSAAEALTFKAEIDDEMEDTTVVFVSILDDAPATLPVTP